MKLTAQEAADFVGGVVLGNPNVVITGLAKIEEAKKDDLTFLYLPAYEHFLSTTNASAILIKPNFKKIREDITYIEVKDPNIALQKIVKTFFTPKIEVSGIDESSLIDPSVKLGSNVTVGKNVVISAGSIIGDNSIILHNTVLMERVTVGSNTILYPNITVRENCSIGNNVIIHSNTCVGSDGFGYIKNEDGEYDKVPQIGNVVIEDDVEIGSNVSIDRAMLGSTVIKQGAKIDNLVQIAHNVVVGQNSVIVSQSGVAGSTVIGRDCVIAAQVGIVGHIDIGDNVTITARAGVSKSLAKGGTYRGAPAQNFRDELKLEAHIRNLPSLTEKTKKLEEKVASLERKILELTSKGT